MRLVSAAGCCRLSRNVNCGAGPRSIGRVGGSAHTGAVGIYGEDIDLAQAWYRSCPHCADAVSSATDISDSSSSEQEKQSNFLRRRVQIEQGSDKGSAGQSTGGLTSG